MYEEMMNDKIITFIENNGYKSYVQIPISLGKVDFVGINNDECIIVESKVHNWKKALKQVIIYGYGAEKSYIAIPNPTAEYIKKKHDIILKKYGIGLIKVDNEAVEIIPCIKKNPSDMFKNIILKEIYKRDKESKKRISNLMEKYNNGRTMV